MSVPSLHTESKYCREGCLLLSETHTCENCLSEEFETYVGLRRARKRGLSINEPVGVWGGALGLHTGYLGSKEREMASMDTYIREYGMCLIHADGLPASTHGLGLAPAQKIKILAFCLVFSLRSVSMRFLLCRLAGMYGLSRPTWQGHEKCHIWVGQRRLAKVADSRIGYEQIKR
jgi:hypothetical protein